MKTKPIKNDEDDYCDSLGMPFLVMGKPAGMDYIVNVNEAFVHPRQFEQIVTILDNATENDSLTINLTTPGGALHAVLPLLGAMDNTQAHVHVHACSDVASAGTFLLMKAHSVSMNEYVTVMCHQVRFGFADEGWNVVKHVDHTIKSSNKLLHDMYEGFLTEEEMARMLTGTPFYMDRDEFVIRYMSRQEMRQKQILEKQEITETTPKKPRKKKSQEQEV